ncbi:MAG: hypothetical protein PHQ05_10770 [Sterolibacterium sp.]|nr:hypothetical protein [Sterolibacterium sp.]
MPEHAGTFRPDAPAQQSYVEKPVEEAKAALVNKTYGKNERGGKV